MGCDDMKVCGASLEGRTSHDCLVIEIVPPRQPPNSLILVVVCEHWLERQSENQVLQKHFQLVEAFARERYGVPAAASGYFCLSVG
jgi:hypothetical protein